MKPIRLDYSPRPWQRECHQKGKRFTVLVLHRRAGKTEMAIMQLIDRAMSNALPMPMYAYLAPFLKQAKVIAWKRLKQKIQPLVIAGVAEVNEGELTATFLHNQAVIRIFGADNPDALRGVRLDGVVLDEVAQMRPEVWNDILQPALSDRLGWAQFIGTVSGVDMLSELYMRAQSLPDWHAALYTVYDTNAIDPLEVERLRRDMSEASFAREYLCDFNAAGDDQLLSLNDVEESSKRVYMARDIEHAPRIVGVDPARFGGDRSVIFKRQGLQAFPPMVYQGIDNMDLASRVANVIESWMPEAVFIDSGAGAGVIDRLRQMGHAVIEVPFGGKAVQPHLFINRRTEMWVEMAQWVRSGGAIPEGDMVLKREMATPVYWFDNSGRKVLESKDDIKKRLPDSGSPDMADALALTFAAPVAKRQKAAGGGVAGSRQRDYNPHDLL